MSSTKQQLETLELSHCLTEKRGNVRNPVPKWPRVEPYRDIIEMADSSTLQGYYRDGRQ
jgi:hypothetical protein